MTDKQIIIAGGRASGITTLQVELNRKTQECEELKEELRTSKDDHAYAVELEKDIDGYKQALEEIKEIAHRLRTKRDYNSQDEVNKDIDSILQKCEGYMNE